MDQRTNPIFFALLRSAIRGTPLTEKERGLCTPEVLNEALKIAAKHDIAHLLALGLQKNTLIPAGNQSVEKCILGAVYRYERTEYEYKSVCRALEEAKIDFLPLKGSILRAYYPEPWMRTSCDIDILVHKESLDAAVAYLSEHLQYAMVTRSAHDISLAGASGIHVELHFDLVEEQVANNSISILSSVWEHASLREGYESFYEMSDAFFYFYHIAHMAKHFENGGCGIRPLIDLWILDRLEGVDTFLRNELLANGDLLKFANTVRALSEVWMDGKAPDALSLRVQDFLLHGGVYGTTENRVALRQKKKGGRLGYFMSRLFVPYERLKRYYPILEKHRWLMPIMQIRRWFMLCRPEIASMAKREIAANGKIEPSKAQTMHDFLDDIGLK